MLKALKQKLKSDHIRKRVLHFAEVPDAGQTEDRKQEVNTQGSRYSRLLRGGALYSASWLLRPPNG